MGEGSAEGGAEEALPSGIAAYTEGRSSDVSSVAGGVETGAETEGKPDPSGKEVLIVERSVWGVGEGEERVLSPGSAVIWARPIPPAPRSTRAKTAAEAAHCRQCRGRPCRRGSGTTLGSAWI